MEAGCQVEYRKHVQKEKNKRQGEVVLTAANLFLERGLENVKMTDIADACGLGVASLYRYFGTKTMLTAAVGERLWQDIIPLFEQNTKNFDRITGLEQLRVLFGVFPRLYEEHRGFLTFIHDFDTMMLREHVDPASLKSYEDTVLSFYPIFLGSYRCGRSDGSVRELPDFETFYFSSTHLLLSLCLKFTVGAVLPIDSEERQKAELSMALDMILKYLS